MSKLLTTGELVDRLKLGEIAEAMGNADLKVKNSSFGFIYVNEEHDIDKDKGIGGYFFIGNDYIKSMKWRILPTYVSLEEAMQALKGGQRVKWISPDGADVVVFYPGEYEDGDGLLADFSFSDLFEGSWTIKED